MNYLGQNLSVIKSKFMPLHDLLVREDWNTEGYQLVQSSFGFTDLSIQLSDGLVNYYNDSEYILPLWLENTAPNINMSNHILLFGVGLGHHLRLLLNQYPGKWFYVYEPDLGVLKTVLKSADMRDILSHPNVKTIAAGDSREQLRQLLFPLFTFAQIEFTYLSASYYNRSANLFTSFKESLPGLYSEYKVNQNTLTRFKDNWLENRLNHLVTNVSTPSIKVLNNQLDHVPAVIVGSGPSLEHDIEVLKQVSRCCFIIAAGSSVQALLHHSIKPDLVVLVDGGRVVEKIFKAESVYELPLLYTPSTNYRVTDRFSGPTFHVLENTDKLTPFFMELDAEEPIFSASASVTGIAIQAAAYLGVTKIILAGQDFSFPADQMYSAGVSHIPAAGVKYIVQGAEVQIENVKGGMNRTTLPYKTLLHNVEHLISGYQGINFINTSRLGARIEGAPFLPFNQAVKELLGNAAIPLTGLRSQVEQFDHYEDLDGAIKVKNKMIEVEAELQSYAVKLSEIAKRIKQLAALSRSNPSKCANLLVKVEQDWSELVNRASFAPLFETMCPTDLNEFDQHLPLIVQEANLIRKCKLIEDHLLRIVQKLVAVIPALKERCSTALLRFERIS